MVFGVWLHLSEVVLHRHDPRPRAHGADVEPRLNSTSPLASFVTLPSLPALALHILSWGTQDIGRGPKQRERRRHPLVPPRSGRCRFWSFPRWPPTCRASSSLLPPNSSTLRSQGDRSGRLLVFGGSVSLEPRQDIRSGQTEGCQTPPAASGHLHAPPASPCGPPCAPPPPPPRAPPRPPRASPGLPGAGAPPPPPPGRPGRGAPRRGCRAAAGGGRREDGRT